MTPSSQDHFEEFQDHTLLKHLVLKTYLDTYVRKLLLRPGAGDLVRFVDACAGKGQDDAGNPGSPILAARIAQQAEAQLARVHGLTVRVRTINIEKKRSHYDSLVDSLAPFRDHAEVLQGTLADHIDTIHHADPNAPTLYFIDPFGLAPLDASVLRRALHGPHNEIFVLFADQAALRHFGVAAANVMDRERETEARLPVQPDLFSTVNEDSARHAREEADDRITGIEQTRPRAIEILDTAFGDGRWREIESIPRDERRQRFVEIYESLLRELGASYVLTLPMRNARGQVVYHLIHASKSARGYTAMKESIETALKQTPLSDEAINSIRFDISTDMNEVEARVRTQFAGATVGWADNDRATPSVRRYVLEETPAFPSELKTLRQRLATLQQPGRTIVYRFPVLNGQ